MFGYVKPLNCQLTKEEQTLYQSVYCGMCRYLGEICGQSARFTLSYDFVFLALLRMGVQNEKVDLAIHRCPSHPFRGKQMVIGSQTLAYCAALSALLQYESIKDKTADEKGCKRIGAYLLLPTASKHIKRAKKKYDLPVKTVRKHLRQLQKAEKDGCRNPDVPAEIFGQLLADVSVYGLEDELLSLAIRNIMFHLGKWIYLLDAADDYKKDQATGAYNPFLPNGPDVQLLNNSLEWELSYCDEMLDKIPFKDIRMKNILENILYSGTAAVQKNVLFPSPNTKGMAVASEKEST